MERRAFLQLFLLGSASLGVALSPALRAAYRYSECDDTLPSSDGNPPLPLGLERYEQLDTIVKADFLLRGGYVTEWWRDDDLTIFSREVADEGKKVIGKAFAELMGEDWNDLQNRLIVTYDKEDYIEWKKKLGFSESEARESTESALGTSTSLREYYGGKQISLINLELSKETNERLYGRDKLDQHVMSITDTILHELNHFAVQPEWTEEDKELLVGWINEILADGSPRAEAILDSPGGTEINYSVGDDTMIVLLGENRRDDYKATAWGEVIREYSQREFRRRLDKRLGRGEPLDYYSYFPFYIGYGLLDYLGEKVGVDKERLLDFLNSFRSKKGNLPMRNVVDLIRFYSNSAKDKGLTVSGSQILKCLSWIEAVAQVALEESDQESKRDKTYNFLQKWWSPPFVEYVCALDSYDQAGRDLIDETLSGQAASSKVSNEEKVAGLIQSVRSLRRGREENRFLVSGIEFAEPTVTADLAFERKALSFVHSKSVVVFESV